MSDQLWSGHSGHVDKCVSLRSQHSQTQGDHLRFSLSSSRLSISSEASICQSSDSSIVDRWSLGWHSNWQIPLTTGRFEVGIWTTIDEWRSWHVKNKYCIYIYIRILYMYIFIIYVYIYYINVSVWIEHNDLWREVVYVRIDECVMHAWNCSSF